MTLLVVPRGEHDLLVGLFVDTTWNPAGKPTSCPTKTHSLIRK